MEMETEIKMGCPKCETELEYCSGQDGFPDYKYCPKCMDWAYDPYTGEKLARLR